MLFRPGARDVRLIGYYLGKVITGLGLTMTIPALLALVLGEWNSLSALLVGAGLSVTVGSMLETRLFTREIMDWSHSMVTVALSWLLGAFLMAIPLYLSGHFSDGLDAVFDAMSGLTTSGLTVIHDLDHLSRSMNVFRHLLHFLGGQGIVIVVLSLMAGGGAQAGTLYVSEAREERIMPNIVRTARFIYVVAGVYLLIGTLFLTASLLQAGLPFERAVFHALNLFMAAFDTGGFSPQSSSIAYYHSVVVEAVLLVLMFAGTLSFGLHFQMWRGDRRLVLRHIETRTLALTIVVLATITMLGLARSGSYEGTFSLFRKGFLTLVSAHTGTGFAFNPPRLYVTDWGTLAPAAIVGAMALGGMASSTAGGIKALRVGLTLKGLIRDVRRVLLPESAFIVQTYHGQRRQILRDDVARPATTVLLLFGLTYLFGSMVGLAYGRWDVTETIFESVSATANVGLTVGITAPDMPALLEITYLAQMWLGRLEFVAAFALFGYVIAMVRGRT